MKLPFLATKKIQTSKPAKGGKRASGLTFPAESLKTLGFNVDGSSTVAGLHHFLHSISDLLSDSVIEIGASSGEASKLILKGKATSLHAFEPNVQFQVALDQLSTDFPERFTWEPQAVGEKVGFTTLRYNMSNPIEGATVLSGWRSNQTTNALARRVNRTTLDEAIGERGQAPQVILCDAFGAADKVLEGWSRKNDDAVEIIILALSPNPVQGETSLSAIADQLPAYDAYRILDGKRGLQAIKTESADANLPYPSRVVFQRKSSNLLERAELDILS